MDLKLGDVQTTALIPLAIKASETMRPKARIKDEVTFGGVRLKPLSKFTGYEEYYKDDNNSCRTKGSLPEPSCWTAS